jgi:hypothetical protein
VRAIVSAYYHSSECVYAFGPFTEAQLDRFIRRDCTPNKHSEWEITWVNDPRLYGSGKELAANG